LLWPPIIRRIRAAGTLLLPQATNDVATIPGQRGELPMRFYTRLIPAAAGLASFVLLAPPIHAKQDKDAPAPVPVRCTELATNPANGLLGAPGVKSVNSQVIAAAGSNVSYCQVNILYGENDQQNINIRVGLPLNGLDAPDHVSKWNGRTQGIGGGGCSGSLAVNGPVNGGYVGSGNDTGHSGGNCEPAVNADGTYNYQFINDFIRNG